MAVTEVIAYRLTGGMMTYGNCGRFLLTPTAEMSFLLDELVIVLFFFLTLKPVLIPLPSWLSACVALPRRLAQPC